MPPKAKPASAKDSSANLGIEARLWTTADKLRNTMAAAEPIHHLAPHGMAGFVLAVLASVNHRFCFSGL